MNERILIIDDLRSKCEYFATLLSEAGYVPFYIQLEKDANTFDDFVDYALSVASGGSIDAIVLDMSMSQLRGEEWTRCSTFPLFQTRPPLLRSIIETWSSARSLYPSRR